MFEPSSAVILKMRGNPLQAPRANGSLTQAAASPPHFNTVATATHHPPAPPSTWVTMEMTYNNVV